MVKQLHLSKQNHFLSSNKERGLLRPLMKIPALLPAVLIADREHAASVGDLNPSYALSTNQRAACPWSLPPLIAETRSPSPGCHITGAAFLQESSRCELSESASQHRAAAGRRDLQVAPPHTTRTASRRFLSVSCLKVQLRK